MTNHQASDDTADALIGETEVAAYLRDDPGFFERHADLLASLRLPHPSGRAVSLVERQMEALRAESTRLKQQIRQLVELARDNEKLNERLHRLTLALIDAVDFSDVITILEDQLHDEFRADAVELKLFSSPQLEHEGESVDPELAAFMDFFQQGKPVCGPLSPTQLKYLFGAEAEDVGSAALLPLRGGDIMGVLAIGSGDADRFHPDMGTDFLVRLAQVVNRKLQVVSLPGV